MYSVVIPHSNFSRWTKCPRLHVGASVAIVEQPLDGVPMQDMTEIQISHANANRACSVDFACYFRLDRPVPLSICNGINSTLVWLVSLMADLTLIPYSNCHYLQPYIKLKIDFLHKKILAKSNA